MIFVTVGSQLPFGRLIRAVDRWCLQQHRPDVFAQIAAPGPRDYVPQYMEWARFLAPEDFDRRFAEASLVIAHAGMGSIIAALMAVKPIVIMPRRASLQEHRNDHQLATARKFHNRPNVHVVVDEAELPAVIDSVLAHPHRGEEPAEPYADPSLTRSLRRYIISGDHPDRSAS
jgi:UDP-N-acetylglucosamine transferase subunit ALG13